jgi:probable phosphoglycerate mutase
MRVPATELLLIRHGETAWNAEGRIQGQLDIPLSPTGMWQAGRLAERFAAEAAAGADGNGVPVAAIYSSGLARAWFTAQPVATKLGVEVRPEPRFVERSFGVFEGHTLEEVSKKWPEDFARWRARDPDVAMPDGESANQVIARVLDGLKELTMAHHGARIAVFTHGGVLDVAYRTAVGLAWDAPRQHVMLNASINRVSSAAPPLKLAILDWGDIDHLAADDAPPDPGAGSSGLDAESSGGK